MKKPQADRTGGSGPAWMLLDIAGKRYAIEIEAVGEVLPVPELSPLPMTPDWVSGIADVRGEVVAVVDAGLRLGGRAAAGERRLVLTHPDEKGERVGLIVDAIAGLVERGADPRAPRLDLEALLDPEKKVPGA